MTGNSDLLQLITMTCFRANAWTVTESSEITYLAIVLATDDWLRSVAVDHNDILDEFSPFDGVAAGARLDVHFHEAFQKAVVQIAAVVDDQVFQLRCKVWT